MSDENSNDSDGNVADQVAQGVSAAGDAVAGAQQLEENPAAGAAALGGAAAGAAGAATGAPQAQQAQQAMGAAGQAASAAQQAQHDPVGGLLGLVGGAAGLAGAAAASNPAASQAMSAVSSAAGAASSVASAASAASSPATASAPATARGADAPASARDEQTAWASVPASDRHVAYRLIAEADAGDGTWTVRRFRLDERLDAPYECVVDVSSDDANADPLGFLGKDATIEIVRGVEQRRNVIGVVRRVLRGASGGNDGHVVATLTIVPALWTLSQGRDSRIFQDKTVPEILQEVLERGLGGLSREVRLELEGTYAPREYCVQWEESDFAFVSRLMEEEGIFYFFDFADEREVMVIADAPTSFQPLETEDGNPVPYTPVSQGSGPIESVIDLTSARQLTANAAMVREYDWTRAATEFSSDTTLEPEGGTGDVGALEEYLHGPIVHFAEYGEPSFGSEDIQKQTTMVVRRRGTEVERATGRSELTSLVPGMKFELTGHPLPAFDQEWLVIAVHHEGANAGEGGGDDAEEYVNRIEAIPAAIEWRPKRTRFKRRVAGVMTATVVGPSGEEIHTDVHGRVRAQFHWDRQGQRDQHSSCFLRSMQPWAGEGWGFVFLPRIGMEVVVSFVDGDIDRPLVIGTVYKSTHVPPLDLPNERTKSIIKSSSTPGGDGYNELSFEDEAGNEKIVIHAQKDMNETIENNHTTSVGGDQSNSVTGDRTHSISKNETITVTGSQKITISGAETADGQTITGAQLDITGDYKLDASKTIKGQAPDQIMFTVGSTTLEMTPDKIKLHCGGTTLILEASQAEMKSNGGSIVRLNADAKMIANEAGEVFLNANAMMKDASGSEVHLDSAKAKLSASTGGLLELTANAAMSGAEATVTGQTKATMSGSTEATVAGGGGSVKTSPAGVDASGATINITGQGMTNIAGGVVKIN